MLLNQHDDCAVAKRSYLGTYVHGSATNADLRSSCCRLPKLKFGWEYRSVQSPVRRHTHIYGLRGGCHTDPETASPETWDGKSRVVFFPTAATLPTSFIPPPSLQRQSHEILSSVHPTVVYLPRSDMSDAEESGSPMLPTDVDLIRPLLDDFKSAKKGERRHVVRRGVTTIMASKDISHLRPLAQAKIIAQVKEVCLEMGYISTGY